MLFISRVSPAVLCFTILNPIAKLQTKVKNLHRILFLWAILQPMRSFFEKSNKANLFSVFGRHIQAFCLLCFNRQPTNRRILKSFYLHGQTMDDSKLCYNRKVRKKNTIRLRERGIALCLGVRKKPLRPMSCLINTDQVKCIHDSLQTHTGSHDCCVGP